MDIHVCVCVSGLPFFQNGITPAYIASGNGEHECLELLIGAKADVNEAAEVRTGYFPSHTLIYIKNKTKKTTTTRK